MLFNIMADPDHQVEHVMMTVYKLWDASFKGTDCILCSLPLACTQTVQDLIIKLGELADGGTPRVSDQETGLILAYADPDSWKTWKGEPDKWQTYLRELEPGRLRHLQQKLSDLMS